MVAKRSRGESGDSPVEPKSYERLSTQLSALLAEMVRAQDVAVADSWSAEVQPGGTVGRFKLVRELGRGGFGIVYEAVDGDLSRTVALKVVKPGTRLANRSSQWLMREAEAVARLNHPNIVTLHDFGQGPTGPYLVFEMLRGRTLAEGLRSGPMPLDQVIDVGIAVTRALVHAHGAGVIHRDLTAANVHLAEDGAVKVLDFGLAHLFGRDGANDGGTPAYMAPEQWEGDQGDARTDLFALGVILFQALTGSFPYKVDKGWSEALEPGETPRIPRRAAPARLRKLVRALLDREPELRPENARAVRDSLLALRQNRDAVVRRRVLGASVTVAAAAVAAAAWLYLRHEAPPGEQVRVVMAAMENGAGEAPLDAVPGLLSAALEPSPRVKLVPRVAAGSTSRGRPGWASRARSTPSGGGSWPGSRGRRCVLVPSAWREDGRPAAGCAGDRVGERADDVPASAIAAAARGAAAAVDQLSDRIRRELNERAEDRRIRRPVAQTVTASPEAARLYYEGLDCLSAGGRRGPGAVPRSFERALALDPTFPLAHYQLAVLGFLPGDSGEQCTPTPQGRAGGGATAASARGVAGEGALGADRGQEKRALRIYDQLLATAPEDPEILAAAADVCREAGDWATAARYLEKLVAVEPEDDASMSMLIEVLGRSNRIDTLRSVVARLEPEGTRRVGVLVSAYAWLGEHEKAIQVARAAVREKGDEQLDALRESLQSAGEYAEMEAIARREIVADPSALAARYRVDMALAAQGRVNDALRWLDETMRITAAGDANSLRFRQAMIVAATGSAERVWRYAASVSAIAPKLASRLAVLFALLGDLKHAEELARTLEPGTLAEVEYRALREWRSGDVAGAMARLAAAEAQDPWPTAEGGMAPAYLMAEIAGASGDDVATLAAVGRFQRLPSDRIWRAWAYPRSLYLSAAAHAHLGDRELAARELDRLLALLAHADPTVSLVKQARSLRSELQHR